jgi:hypothetical protein
MQGAEGYEQCNTERTHSGASAKRQRRFKESLSVDFANSAYASINRGPAHANLGCWPHVRFAPILLKKSKIERLQKSRERQFLFVSAAASLFSMSAAVSDRFCRNLCGPSRRRA